MKVFGISTDKKEEWTTPYPKSKFGIKVRFTGGDVIYPVGSGDWFKPPYFKRTIKFYMPVPLMPFFSIRIGPWGFYIGAKIFGVDSSAYVNWMCGSEDIYDGSIAMMLMSVRFTTNLKE